MNELITVIINACNVEKYIGKCIESVINQTYKNIEILIINDGSTDDTLKVCKRYNDNRIRIINQENMGLSKSRNVGIENSNGEYLYFVDADDFIENDVIEYLYKLAKSNNVLIATCKPKDIYNYNFVVKNKKEKITILSNKEMLDKLLLSIDRSGTIWNKLIKKELFNEIRFEDRIIDDVVVTYKLILDADKIVYSNQIKYYYLKHVQSILGQKKPELLIDIYNACVERYEYIKKIYPDYIENDISLLSIIMTLYLDKNKKIQDFLTEKEALNLFKKLFSFNMLKTKMKFRDKLKILLFRISPKLYKFVIKIYLKIK